MRSLRYLTEMPENRQVTQLSLLKRENFLGKNDVVGTVMVKLDEPGKQNTER